MELMILLIVPFQLALWRIGTGSSVFQFPSQTPVGWPLGEKGVEPRALQSACFRRQLQGHRVFMWPSPHKSQEKEIKGKINVKFMFWGGGGGGTGVEKNPVWVAIE